MRILIAIALSVYFTAAGIIVAGALGAFTH